jgi:hypothetical protein
MMTETRINRIEQHLWLKHPKQTKFHAYGNRTTGTLPFCGDQNGIPENLNDMEIPGTNSGTCYECFCKLYNMDQKKGKK